MEGKLNVEGFETLSSEEREELRRHVHENTDDETAKDIFDDAVPGAGEESENESPAEPSKPESDPFEKYHKDSTPSSQGDSPQQSFMSTLVQYLSSHVSSFYVKAKDMLTKTSVKLVLMYIALLIIGVLIGCLITPKQPPIVL